MARRLADLVEKVAAQQGLDLDPSHPPFGGGSTRNAPLLRPSRAPNHVLLFPGSFNPPHRGHAALLDHVFRNAGADLSLVAAIIVLTDDDKLAAKNGRDERPFLLSKAKRASLWREADILTGRLWVFEGSEVSWKDFREKLQKCLARDKIELKFLLLLGPDWITTTSLTEPKSWGCTEAVTSDVSRPVDFRCPNSLRQLPGCSMWELLSYLTETQPSVAAIDAKGAQNNALESPYDPGRAVWTCQTLRRPLRRYRFVPCQSSLPRGEAPSSTEIRRVIATSPREQLDRELNKFAIGPPLLLRYALEGGPYTAPAAREPAPDHETRKTKAAVHVQW